MFFKNGIGEGEDGDIVIHYILVGVAPIPRCLLIE